MLIDVFGKDVSLLNNKKLFLFDMDGTIYKDNVLFDGVLELLDRIKKIDGKFIFITNNSSKSVDDYIIKINKLGIKADITNFCTSSQATVMFLNENYQNKKIYCQGTKSMIEEFAREGINVTTKVENDVDAVVVGFDTELTSEKLRNTCELLTRGLPFIATNMDLICPVSFGYIPDCGSICMMLENATGKKPIYIGKPESKMVDIITHKYKFTKEETVIVGDRLYTDIATGVNAGITTVCVLTGETNKQDIISSSIKPTITMNSIKDINLVYRI